MPRKSKVQIYDEQGDGIILNRIGELALNAIKALLPELVSKLGNMGVDKLASVIKNKMQDHVEKTGSGIRILGETKGNGVNSDPVLKESKQVTGNSIGSKLPRKTTRKMKGEGVLRMEGSGIRKNKISQEPAKHDGGCSSISFNPFEDTSCNCVKGDIKVLKEKKTKSVEIPKLDLKKGKGKDKVDLDKETKVTPIKDMKKEDFNKLYKRSLNMVSKLIGHDNTTWSDELHKFIKSNKVLNKNFKGVYPFDHISKIKSKAKKQRYILNTADTGEQGEHWILYIIENGDKFIYDSLGKINLDVFENKPQNFSIISSKQMQCINDQNCGQHTIAALYLINKYGIDALKNL